MSLPVFCVVILLPTSTCSRNWWEQLFATIREKKMNVPAQIKAVKQKVIKGWVFAETSFGTEIGACWVASVIHKGLMG